VSVVSQYDVGRETGLCARLLNADWCNGVDSFDFVQFGPCVVIPELIPVLGSQPAGDVSHKPGDRLPLLSARPAVTLATLKRAATNFAAR